MVREVCLCMCVWQVYIKAKNLNCLRYKHISIYMNSKYLEAQLLLRYLLFGRLSMAKTCISTPECYIEIMFTIMVSSFYCNIFEHNYSRYFSLDYNYNSNNLFFQCVTYGLIFPLFLFDITFAYSKGISAISLELSKYAQ